MIVEQRIGRQANVGEVGEEFEQRITGRRHQDFVTRLAQQSEYIGIGFAGAGGEKNALGINAFHRTGECSAPAIVLGDGGASLRQAAAFGPVLEGLRIGQRRKDRRLRVGEATNRGIRSREVEQLAAAAPVSFEGQGEAVWFEPPVCAGSEHAGLMLRCLRLASARNALVGLQPAVANT